MTNSGENPSHQVKAQIANMPNLIVDIIAKQIQKEHIEEDVPKVAVKECVSYKLPQRWVSRSEHKLLGPVVDWHDLKLTSHNSTMRAIG